MVSLEKNSLVLVPRDKKPSLLHEGSETKTKLDFTSPSLMKLDTLEPLPLASYGLLLLLHSEKMWVFSFFFFPQKCMVWFFATRTKNNTSLMFLAYLPKCPF